MATRAKKNRIVKLPRLPRFSPQQYRTDDESPAPQIRMTIAQWAAVPRNPFQKAKRDTARKLDHLYNFKKEHATVRMGIYPDGRCCKIEGHSRCRLYTERPDLVDKLPKYLTVECYPVRDDAHAAERFRIVDNKKTAKNAADDVHGSFRLAGIPTESKFFQSASNIKSALQYAYGIVADSGFARKMKSAATLEDWVATFKEALAALDTVNVNRDRLCAPFITAFLLGYTKHGEDILPFFNRVNAGTHGRKDGKKMCPIAAIEHERDVWRGGGVEKHMELTATVLGALDTFMESARFREEDYIPKVKMQKVMRVDLDQYLLRAKSKRTGRTRKFTR